MVELRRGQAACGLNTAVGQSGGRPLSVMASVQEAADGFLQLGGGKRFFEKGRQRIAIRQPPQHRLIHKSGDVEHWKRRTKGADVIGQVGTVHERHEHIGQQQIDSIRIDVAERDGLLSAPRFEHTIAAIPEEQGHERPKRVLVFHE